jgi:ubiquinone biosynthesis protein
VAETWMKMVFVHGVFHGDPHPANIIVVRPDAIGLVDFGQVGQLTARDRTAAVRLFLDIVNQDFDRLPRRLRELGVRYPRELEEDFREQLSVLLQRYYGAALSEIDARELIGEIFATIYRLQIELPARWVMLDKTIATLAGVGLEIYPDFNVFETAGPYAKRMVSDRYRPDRLAARARSDIQRFTETILEYPFQVSDLLNEFRDGEVKITINLENFNDLIAKAQAAVNRVALAVLAAAIFLGSAIIGAAVAGGPHLFGVNVLALPGIAVGIVLAILLLLSLFRSRG